ncbi:hypothetical protein GCM10011391_14640 [Pullulanibacillus camelliae]|uniref:Uncharacterized protein n=1 Tax=Pullulanibacillus camelliae TaxID=1707096 RepID=A0A8J2VR95_9BACL|nr:hypothetical protein [Pullulanibacillus camelliae]GGE36831.1 hypothetical protein GCM10011391_14640 [Pullulanibacillus camelliae]
MTETSNKKRAPQDIKDIAEKQMNEGGIWSSSNSSEAIAEKPTETKTED